MLTFLRKYRLRKHLRNAVLTGRVKPLLTFLAKEYKLEPATVLETTKTVIRAQLFAIRNAVKGYESRYIFRNMKRDSERVMKHMQHLERNIADLELEKELRARVDDIRKTLKRRRW